MRQNSCNLRVPRAIRRFTNKFTILVIMSLLLTVCMTKPASPLVMIEYQLGNLSYGIETRPRDITVGWYETGPSIGPRVVAWTEQFPGRIGWLDRSVGGNAYVEALLPQGPVGQNAEPWGLAFEPGALASSQPRLWFTDNRLNVIGVLSLVTFQYFGWTIPTLNSEPRGIFVQNSSAIWFTEYRTGKIGCLDWTSGGGAGTFVEWQLPDVNSQPNDIIVAGSIVYFTEYGRDRIGSYNMSGLGPQGQYIKEFILPAGSAPWGLTADNNGMIWFTCSGRNVIGMLNPYTGEITEHRSIPTDNSQPHGISFDSVTGNVWFTEYQGHRIAKYVPSTNIFYEYPTLTAGSAPNDVAVQRFDQSGSTNQTLAGTADVWFTEYVGNRIGLISQGGPIQGFGTTTTATVTTVTSAVSAIYSAGSSTTTTSRNIVPGAAPPPGNLLNRINVIATTTNATTQTQSETVYRLSTSTLGTSTSFIVEVAYTSVTSTSTSTTFVTTTSVTSSTTYTSTSTSYIGTTLITSTSTSFVTVPTGTVTRTSTSVVSIPNTLTTTVTETKYKTTTFGGTTLTTSTSTQHVTQTNTAYTTASTTTTKTTTSSATTTTYTIPPVPSCFIASAAYGSPLSSQVQALRIFRDRLVLQTFAGTQFMKAFNAWYYSFSPTVAAHVSNSPVLASVFRALIYPLIGILQVAAAAYTIFSYNSELGVTVAGLVASSLIGLVYHTPWITPLLIALKKKRGFQIKMRYFAPFVCAWVISLIVIELAGFLMVPVLMMIATASFVLLTLGLSATLTSTLIAKKLA